MLLIKYIIIGDDVFYKYKNKYTTGSIEHFKSFQNETNGFLSFKGTVGKFDKEYKYLINNFYDIMILSENKTFGLKF